MTEQGTENTVTITAPDEEIIEESEVVELPPNVEHITQKMEQLKKEIAHITNAINANKNELDTRVAAFSWYSQQLESAEWENLNPSMEKK